MDKILTIEDLKEMQPGVFASGTVENSVKGVYMTDESQGRKLTWVAVRGRVHDWAVYCHWEDECAGSIEFVRKQGQKIFDRNNVKKLVPCSQEALKMYRS